jgi:predicted O-methyltransferase YrrM
MRTIKMKQTSTETRYRDIFEKEAQNTYPAMDQSEAVIGFSIDKEWLDSVAFALNCPVKTNPPNWQHGRLIYALVRQKVSEGFTDMDSVMLDIGTAKGFSACVIAKALYDSNETLPIYTVDIVDPMAKVVRNTFLEIDGLKTVPEMLNPRLPVGQRVSYYGGGSAKLLDTLVSNGKRVLFAFVDGKHSYASVKYEGEALRMCQREGDIIVFDDCQIPDVERAVDALDGYAFCKIENGPRKYAVARKLP